MTTSDDTATNALAPTEPQGPGTDDSGAKEVAKSAADKVTQVAGSAADNAKSVVAEASTQTKAVATQAREQFQTLAEQTKSELMAQADTKGQQAGAGLRTLSDQISALGDGRPDDAGHLTHYLREADEKVAALASRIEQGGPQGVLDDVTAFARRRPGMFVLGAIGAGFIAGRLIRSGAAAAPAQGAPDAGVDQRGGPVAPPASPPATEAADRLQPAP